MRFYFKDAIATSKGRMVRHQPGCDQTNEGKDPFGLCGTQYWATACFVVSYKFLAKQGGVIGANSTKGDSKSATVLLFRKTIHGSIPMTSGVRRSCSWIARGEVSEVLSMKKSLKNILFCSTKEGNQWSPAGPEMRKIEKAKEIITSMADYADIKRLLTAETTTQNSPNNPQW